MGSTSESLLRSLLDNVPDLVYFKDREGRYVEASKSYLDELGVDPDEMKGKKAPELFPGDTGEVFFEDDMRVMEEEEMVVREQKIEDSEGETIWLSTIKIPRYDDEGNVIGMLGISRDITDRKKIEADLKDSEKKYRTIFENAGTLVIIQDGKFRRVNPEFLDLTGYSEDELIGRNSLFIVPREEREKVRRNAVQMLKGERSEPYEHRIITKNGETRWIVEKVTSIHYNDERAALTSFIDITDREKIEKKRELLSSMLRLNLRNKVQIANGYLNLLEGQKLPEEGRDQLRRAKKAIEEAMNLIEKIKKRSRRQETREFEITKKGTDFD